MTETRATILVIDDDPKVRRLLTRLLTQEGFDSVEADGPKDGLEVMEQFKPDLVLLDVMLQESDGIDLLQQIRATSELPVILLTALGDEADRILGLRSGADDYVVKPFSPGELTARIDSVLRRAQRAMTLPNTLVFGPLCIDPNTRDVYLSSELVVLTAKEFDLLAFLAASPRHVFTREQLLSRVWGSSSEWQDPATVTEHIRRIRRKIETDPDHPRFVVTVRGVGYRFEP
jgi:DNA-binding response OmpR family regulator